MWDFYLYMALHFFHALVIVKCRINISIGICIHTYVITKKLVFTLTKKICFRLKKKDINALTIFYDSLYSMPLLSGKVQEYSFLKSIYQHCPNF